MRDETTKDCLSSTTATTADHSTWAVCGWGAKFRAMPFKPLENSTISPACRCQSRVIFNWTTPAVWLSKDVKYPACQVRASRFYQRCIPPFSYLSYLSYFSSSSFLFFFLCFLCFFSFFSFFLLLLLLLLLSASCPSYPSYPSSPSYPSYPSSPSSPSSPSHPSFW